MIDPEPRVEPDMEAKRIVANVAIPDPAAARSLLPGSPRCELLVDLGWIATYGTGGTMRPQVSFMTEGGAGAPALTSPSRSTTSTPLSSALEAAVDALA